MIRYTSAQNIIICDTCADFDALENVPDGVRVICSESNKAHVCVNGQLLDLTAGGSFTGTLDDITGGATNLHLTAALKSTYDGLATNSHAPGSDNQDLSGKVDTNDSRLSDARTPLTHNHDGSYAPTHTHPYATDSHNHDSSYSAIHTHPYAADVHNHDTAYETKNTNIQTHISSTSNPHSTTAAQVGALATTVFSGLTKITVGTSAPSSPSTGDLWIDSN